VLNIAGFFFMIPFGLSSAAAVRVGQAMGRQDPAGVRLAGWSALGLAVSVGLVVAALFVVLPSLFMGVFTRDAAIVETGTLLLLICAAFQPFDALQAVSTGALRGLGDTRSPMIANLVGHWSIGLPVAYVSCFTRGWGVVGLWTGLAVGLVLVGSALAVVWQRRSRSVGRFASPTS
jgi:MATE family multidrug resistance protein